MTKYNILYVDEEASQRNKFKRFMGTSFNVEAIHPPPDLAELLAYIEELNPDAVVVDHNFREEDPNVVYDGVDVIKSIHHKRKRFPAFVLTSFDEKAIAAAEDVNYVYPKNAISENREATGEKTTFKERVQTQIKHYLERIAEAEKSLEGLLKLSKERSLNVDEEARLIELDTFLNEEIGAHLDIPEELKKSSHIQKTQELIDVSQKLIQIIGGKINAEK